MIFCLFVGLSGGAAIGRLGAACRVLGGGGEEMIAVMTI